MKFIIVLLAILGLTAAHRLPIAAPECPDETPGGGAILLPNEDDCSTYYVCLEGIPNLFDCFPGTWFNPNVGVCDWPQNIPEGICTPPPSTSTWAPTTLE